MIFHRNIFQRSNTSGFFFRLGTKKKQHFLKLMYMSLFNIRSLQYFTCARLPYLVSCSYGALYLTLFLLIACRSSYQSGSLPRPRATVKPLPAHHHRDLGRFSSLMLLFILLQIQHGIFILHVPFPI
jgi:hypothetical protein